MTRYSTESRDIVKGHRFFPFARNVSRNIDRI